MMNKIDSIRFKATFDYNVLAVNMISTVLELYDKYYDE